MKSTLSLICLFLAALFLLPHHVLAEPKSTLVCHYETKDADPETASFQPRGKCAYLRGGQLFVSSVALSKMDFSQKGLAVMATDGQWFYVRRDGSTIPSLRLDAFIDPFLSGRARYTDHGKTGFINESGDIVIPARYTAAYVFNYGYAMVNNGGHEVVIDEQDSIHDTEGGRWGCIDTKGRVVIPVKYSWEEARRKLKALDRRAAEKDELTDQAEKDFHRSQH